MSAGRAVFRLENQRKTGLAHSTSVLAVWTNPAFCLSLPSCLPLRFLPLPPSLSANSAFSSLNPGKEPDQAASFTGPSSVTLVMVMPMAPGPPEPKLTVNWEGLPRLVERTAVTW